MSALPDPIETSDLLAWRRELPLAEATIHLVNHSLGPMPRGVEAELAAFAGAWRDRGVRAWSEGWWELPLATGDLLAPLVGAPAGTLAMHANVSVALAVLLSALDFPAGRSRIVTLALDFPTTHYVLYGEARRGAEIVQIPAADPIHADEARLLESIDARTRVAVVSHVLFRSSYRIDAAALAARCREVGAILVLDTYQSAGILPVELERWGVDAAVGGSVKWLCGGPGAGYLYVRPDRAAELVPAASGWQADEEPFAFRPGPLRPAAGARRFLTGTPAVPSLLACRPGYRMIRAVGIERIRARSVALTELLIREADRHGLAIATPRDPSRRGGTVTVAHADAERIGAALLAEGILCDVRRGAGIRLGPHFFNSEEECARAIERLAVHARGG